MLQHILGGAVMFLSLQHFISPDLNYCPPCKPELVMAATSAVIQIISGKNTFKFFLALIGFEGQLRLEVNKINY